MAEKFVVDGKSIRALVKLLDEMGLTEIEYQRDTHRIRVVRTNPQTTASHYALPTPQPISPSSPPTSCSDLIASIDDAIAQGEVITSPMVGTAYLSNGPGLVPFIKIGDFVKKGNTLLIIETMRVMNPIRAPQDGKILEIYIKDTSPVEFGEPLIKFG